MYPLWQDFLNAFFRYAWSPLPWLYNATKGMYACHRHNLWDLATVRAPLRPPPVLTWPHLTGRDLLT